MINLYGLTLTISLGIGTIWSYRRLIRVGFKRDDLENIILLAAPATLLGARVHHVLTDWHIYSGDFARVFYIWNGGLGIWGGVICGFGSVFIYAKLKEISFPALIGQIAVPLFFVFMVGRWANVFNQELLPYAYFESAASLGIFLLSLLLEKKFKEQHHYRVFIIAITTYALVRFLLEFTRFESRFGLFTINQYVSLLVAIYVILGWYVYEKND